MPSRPLTAAAVQRIKPPKAGQVDHFDKGYPGLALRVSYGGGKSWVFFYRLGGKLRRMTLGTHPAITLAEAREAWRGAREDVATGRDPSRITSKSAGDFAAVAADWLKRDQDKNKSRGEVKRVLDRELIPAWGHRTVSDINRRDVMDLIDGIADRGSPIMARRVHAYVHRFFKWAVGRGIVDANPASDLPKPGSEIKRDRVLSDKELTSIWKAAKKIGWPFGPAIQLLILTGARREEISQLEWSEIDTKNATINLSGKRTKNAQPHDILLSPPALELVKSLRRIEGSRYVFTTTGKTPISGWSRVKTDLPNDNWRLHDLRRTVATGLQKLGTALPVTEAILGHVAGSRSGIVGVYQRYTYDAERRAALDAWGKHVMGLVR